MAGWNNSSDEEQAKDHMEDPGAMSKNSTAHYALSFWMNGVLSLILVIVGMIGNISVMVSFHCCGGTVMKQRRKQAFYYYLMTFAMWNTSLLMATVLFNCVPALLARDSPSDIAPDLYHMSSVFYLIGYWMGNCCVTADVWLAVVVTVERYLAVARPLRSRLTSPRRRARLVCLLLSILVVFYNLPLAFELTLTTAVPNYESSNAGLGAMDGNGSTGIVIDPEEGLIPKLCLSPLRDNVYYQFVYRVVAHALFVSIVPFLTILLLTIKIVLVVRESDRRRARMRKPTSSSDNQGTGGTAALASSSVSRPDTPTQSCHHRYADVLLTMIAVKFLVFYTLPVVINIVELTADPHAFDSEDSEAAKILLFLVDLANLLVVVDGATNSFFYFSWRNRATVRRSTRRQHHNGPAMDLESRYALGVIGPNGALVTDESPKRRSGEDRVKYTWSAKPSL